MLSYIFHLLLLLLHHIIVTLANFINANVGIAWLLLLDGSIESLEFLAV